MIRYERPDIYDSVIIFDADCPYCSAATKALRRVDGLGAVSWDASIAQSVLTAQFDDVPYAVILVDIEADRVYVGRNAARELADRAGLPDLVSDIVVSEFDRIERAIETISDRERDPDDVHGEVPLTVPEDVIEELVYQSWSLPTR
ncbi:DCC1-like thiol-disulfide oxidoreductase family protein [Natrinema gelatinilyticum]|uniref:DCC1-like thiol-disulfide oxidoreductase family protein n=1 Tax=Natrinema gelatinilyticum TaxID=2961571 RepID=UPI0020C2E1BB|nr:DCC1-like thiol-disulfide oxidoreductase family protein [Natrinema gelatinilyticum]